jgi:hypothetical protein
LEYGSKPRWTTEVYLSGQSTQNDSTVFTGFRWESRVRALMRNYFINPVRYVEFEDINAADRSFLEVVTHDFVTDAYTSNAEARTRSNKLWSCSSSFPATPTAGIFPKISLRRNH